MTNSTLTPRIAFPGFATRRGEWPLGPFDLEPRMEVLTMADNPRFRVEIDIPIGRSGNWETEVEHHATMASALRSLLIWSDLFDAVSIIDEKTGRTVATFDGELVRNRDTVELYVHRPDRGWTHHWNLSREWLESRIVCCSL